MGNNQISPWSSFDNHSVLNVESGSFDFSTGNLCNGSSYNGAGRTVIGNNENDFYGVTLDGSIYISPNTTFEFRSGRIDSNATIKGTMKWTGGTIAGSLTIPQNSKLLIDGNDTKEILTPSDEETNTIINEGTTLLKGTGELRGGGTFDNKGTFTAVGDSTIYQVNFLNSGTFIKEGSEGTTSLEGYCLHNLGTIDIQTGILKLADGKHYLGNGTKIKGNKPLIISDDEGWAYTEVAGNIFTLDNAYIILEKGGGIYGNATIEGRLDWYRGEIEDGVFRIGPDSKMFVYGLADPNGNFPTFDNIVNEGITEFKPNGCILGVSFTNSNTGLVYGSGTLQGSFNNEGTLNLQSTFNIGGYKQGAQGLLEIKVSNANGSVTLGKLNLVGYTAELNGSFKASFVDGFSPNEGQTFKVIEYTGHQGEFSEVSAVNLNTPLNLKPVYNTEDFSLVIAHLSAAPTGLVATGISSNQIDLEWETVTGASSYRIYRATSRSETYSYIGTAGITSYSNTGLSANTTYWYKVCAVISEEEGPPSVEASGKTLEDNWQEWSHNANVPINKTWTIEFNCQLDRDSVNPENIYVLDENNAKIEVNVAVIDVQDKYVQVEAPTGGYMIGKTYTLYINKNVKSVSGKFLNYAIKMNFTVGQ